MTVFTKTTIHNGWQRLRAGASRLRASNATKSLSRALADLVYPPACLSCSAELIEAREVPLCDECFEGIELFADPMCLKCGAPAPNFGSRGNESTLTAPKRLHECYHCRDHKMWFDETIALGLYGGKLREIMLRMKRAEGDSLSLAMGRLFWQERSSRLEEIKADVVAPIPLHWRRRVAHRTNSAAVVAEVVSRRLGAPLANGLLRRARSTLRQFDLTPPERWKNVRRAFSLRAGYHLREAHVLLVDDVLTTGATCSEAARALREGGAKRVTVAVIARAMG